jgi:uncharacterized membrane protein YfhO
MKDYGIISHISEKINRMQTITNRKDTFKRILDIAYPALTLGVIFLCYFLLYSLNGFYPFSKDGHTVLMIDAQSQYISYYRYFRNLLLEHGSFIYTGSKAFGGDFMSIYAYYLASPFNFLIVFFSEADIPAFILIISIIKMMLGGMFMYFLLRSKKGNPSLCNVGIGICYGLLSYAFVYQCNFMWLDAAMILPAVVLGLEKLMQHKMKWLYPVALYYALVSSWYTGAMICVFCVVYFLAYYFKDKKADRNWKRIVDFALFSLCGGLLSGILWVTAFLHFSGTKVQSNLPSFSFYSISTFIHGFLYDGYQSVNDITQNEGYIPAFTSLVLTIYAIHFFFNRNYRIRFRLSFFFVILFYFLMSSTSISYTLLHFGSVPTWFPSRYAFVYSFLVCLYAYYQNDRMEKESVIGFLLSDIVIAGLIAIAILVKDNSNHVHTLDTTSLVILIVTTCVCLLSIILERIPLLKGKKKTYILSAIKIMAVPLAIYSSYIGDNHILSVNKQHYQDYSVYQDDDSYTKSVNLLKEYAGKDSTYRMELTFNRPGNYNEINNNPMFYSYNGISHFSSSEKKDVEKYMLYLGFHYNYFFEGYDCGSTVAANSYLGIKYLMDLDDGYERYRPKFLNSSAFTEITSIQSDVEDIHYYENTTALPLGFVVENSDYSYVSEGKVLDDDTTYWFDHFEYQNQIYHEMTSQVEEDIFTPITYKIRLNGMTLDESNPTTQDYYYSGKKGDSMYITFDNPSGVDDYNLYLCLKDLNEDFDVYADGNYVEIANYWHKGIKGLSTTRKSHSILLYAKKSFSHEHIRPEIYMESLPVLRKYHDVLISQGANDLKTKTGLFSYTYYGTFNLTQDNGMFLFTLPYESDFQMYVDGKKVETYQRFNIFTGGSLDGVEKGEHTIQLVYQDKGLILGFFLTLLGIGLTIFLIIYINHIDNRKKNLIKGLDMEN